MFINKIIDFIIIYSPHNFRSPLCINWTSSQKQFSIILHQIFNTFNMDWYRNLLIVLPILYMGFRATLNFRKFLYIGFRATLNCRKFKVALNPMYRSFLNFAKNYVLSCLSKVDHIKKFTVPFFNYKPLKL